MPDETELRAWFADLTDAVTAQVRDLEQQLHTVTVERDLLRDLFQAGRPQPLAVPPEPVEAPVEPPAAPDFGTKRCRCGTVFQRRTRWAMVCAGCRATSYAGVAKRMREVKGNAATRQPRRVWSTARVSGDPQTEH